MSVSLIHLLMIATLVADGASCSMGYESPTPPVATGDDWVKEALNEPLESADSPSCASPGTSTLK